MKRAQTQTDDGLTVNLSFKPYAVLLCSTQFHMMNHRLFPTGPTLHRTSGTTWNTSGLSEPTTKSTRWLGPSMPSSPLETLWDWRPMKDMNTEKGTNNVLEKGIKVF